MTPSKGTPCSSPAPPQSPPSPSPAPRSSRAVKSAPHPLDRAGRHLLPRRRGPAPAARCPTAPASCSPGRSTPQMTSFVLARRLRRRRATSSSASCWPTAGIASRPASPPSSSSCGGAAGATALHLDRFTPRRALVRRVGGDLRRRAGRAAAALPRPAAGARLPLADTPLPGRRLRWAASVARRARRADRLRPPAGHDRRLALDADAAHRAHRRRR